MKLRVPMYVAAVTFPIAAIACFFIIKLAKKSPVTQVKENPHSFSSVDLIDGSIDLKDQQLVQTYPFVFVSISTPESKQPYAAKKILVEGKEKIQFQVSNSDIMGERFKVPPRFSVSVRLDKDGDALTIDGPKQVLDNVALGESQLIFSF